MLKGERTSWKTLTRIKTYDIVWRLSGKLRETIAGVGERT